MPRSDRTLDRVRRGGLPAPLNRQLWVGPGSNKPCDGCGERISGDEREFEINFADTLTFSFHPECYKAWMSITYLAHSTGTSARVPTVE